MQALYDYGYRASLQGAPWRKTLPATYQVAAPPPRVAAPRTAVR
jgi:hypothetical protein